MGPTDTTRSDQPAPEGWQTLRRFLPYLWPAGHREHKLRIIGAGLLVLASKAVQLSMGFVYGAAINRMAHAPIPSA